MAEAEAIVSPILEQLAVERLKDNVGRDEMAKLKENLLAIKPVIEDAEKRQVEEKEVKTWLEKLRGTSYDIEDVLDEWNLRDGKLQKKEVEEDPKLWKKVRSLVFSRGSGSNQVRFLYEHIAHRIEGLNKTLGEIVEQKDSFNFNYPKSTIEKEMSSPVIYLPKVVGKDYDKNAIVKHLLNESSQAPTDHLPIISIVEMIGTEKTTLSKLVVEDDRVKENFKTIITVYVHKFFDEILIAKAILTYLKQDVAPNLVKLETLLGEIRRCLESKKFLLVVDDVWIEIPKTWKLFKHLCGSQGSSILVTTSTIKSAKMMGTTNMFLLGNEWQSSLVLFREIDFSRKTSEDKMSDVECWSLFSKVVFSTLTCEERECASSVFKKIPNTCNGLPSDVKILGSLLSLKTNSKQWDDVDNKLIKLEKMKTPFHNPLLLSYYELSSTLKKCFLYCAIFPKDFVINKDSLIKLWMAEGYLRIPGREDLELVGEEYFAILAMRHFFQDFERSLYDGSIMRCKMPHIVHDFAKFLTKKECLTQIGKVDHKKSQSEIPCNGTRHVMMIDNSISISYICNKKKLRSLIVNKTEIGGELFNLFEELTCLRTLDLSDCSIEKIPRNIKNLIHLRYLNLSHNEKIEELPETLCELYQLQSLDLSNCYRLEKLPCQIKYLINLRQLINHRTCLNYMPKGIETLTCLQRLTKFVVSNDENAGSLGCLKNLKQLDGFLSLTGLGNVSDEEEINQGKLEDKKNIYGLSLKFDGWTNIDNERIFKQIKPPPNLGVLVIQFYTGKTMPLHWIKELTKLRMLKLMFCSVFKDFPHLGKLSSLESLIICNAGSVEKVDDAFFGVITDGTGSSSSGTSIVFPKLRYLKFWNMVEWDELRWSKSVIIMPCLRYLVLDSCPKLKSLSHLGELPSLESLIIKRMNRVKKAGNEFLGTISSASSTVYTFPQLQCLEFEDMRDWEEWNVKWDEKVMPNLISLKFLSCRKLVALPNNLLQRPALQKLIINDCRILKENYIKETGKKWSRISHISYIQIDSSKYVHGNLINNSTTDLASTRQTR